MWRLLLVVLVLVVQASAQSPPVVPFPQDYKTSLVKYAVVDRSDGLSRDVYASRDAVDAVKRNPRLQEFPAGVLFALDVYSARLVGRDRKTQASIFEATPQGHLVRSKDERTLHLMQLQFAHFPIAPAFPIWAMNASRWRLGTRSRESSRRFALESVCWIDMPVVLPPGRARLATSELPTGSAAPAKTIGMVDVACFATRTAAVPYVTMTFTLSRTNSPTISAERSVRPSATDTRS